MKRRALPSFSILVGCHVGVGGGGGGGSSGHPDNANTNMTPAMRVNIAKSLFFTIRNSFLHNFHCVKYAFLIIIPKLDIVNSLLNNIMCKIHALNITIKANYG